MDLRIRQTQDTALKQRQKLAARIRVATLMKLPENTFGSFVKEIEDDPAFRKLLSPTDRAHQVVSYRRFPGVACALNLYELKEEINRDKTSFDIESLVQDRKEVMALIRGIGAEKFEQYFLYNEDGLTPEEVGSFCGLQVDDVKKINAVIDELSIHSEFYHPSETLFESQISYHKVAAIEEDGTGNFIIKFFSPRFTRGKYVIDYTKFNTLKKQSAFTAEELARVNKIIKNLEMINARKSTLYQIMLEITKWQAKYLHSGDQRDLISFTQKELAREIRIDESLVSRALYGKSIETPRNGEKPLQFFFPSKKDIRKLVIRSIIQQQGDKLTDQKITDILREQYRVTVSRRTINVCRKEIEAGNEGKP